MNPEIMEKKQRRFYVDWWQIRRSTIYGAAAIILLLSGLIGGGWWVYRNDFFLAKPETTDIPKDAARIVSFEGDVRIIRAATRETILVTKLTFVSAGDTIQTQADGRAQIQMIDGSTLSIRPNSTVVIRDSASIFGGTNVRVTLDDGQINVKTQDQTEQTENVVEVLESESRLFPQTDASFNINEQTKRRRNPHQSRRRRNKRRRRANRRRRKRIRGGDKRENSAEGTTSRRAEAGRAAKFRADFGS
jgi:hypothetical protein